jgi:hypothetical protein
MGKAVTATERETLSACLSSNTHTYPWAVRCARSSLCPGHGEALIEKLQPRHAGCDILTYQASCTFKNRTC